MILVIFMVSGLSGDKFRFDPNGDGPARYNIIHFKQITTGNYQWVRVGEYMEGELRLNMSGEYSTCHCTDRILLTGWDFSLRPDKVLLFTLFLIYQLYYII